MKTESRMKRRRPSWASVRMLVVASVLTAGLAIGSCRRSILRYNGSIEQGDLRGWPLFIVVAPTITSANRRRASLRLLLLS